MNSRLGLVALVAAFALALPPAIEAQQAWRLAQAPKAKGPAKKAAPPPPAEDDEAPEIEELTPAQIRRAQEPPPPSVGAVPKGPPAAVAQPKTGKQETGKQETGKQALPAQPRAVACSGVFAKDSNHLKLATMFSSENITFGEVDGPDGGKLPASILFPRDPRRRLEVLWQDDGARSGIAVIAINGQSGWTAPKGLALRMPLTSLERANGKPFKLNGLDKDNNALVSSWQGGALEALPGGCKIGVRLAADPRAPAAARSALPAGEGDFVSTDPKVRAVRLTVSEILLGY